MDGKVGIIRGNVIPPHSSFHIAYLRHAFLLILHYSIQIESLTGFEFRTLLNKSLTNIVITHSWMTLSSGLKSPVRDLMLVAIIRKYKNGAVGTVCELSVTSGQPSVYGAPITESPARD